MKKKIFIAAVLFIYSNVQAQDNAQNLSEVVVTSNKYPIKTSSTGKVVTVITREQLEKSGGKDLSQVLTEQCGLSINGANSNLGKDKGVYLRGAKVDHTLIMLDGVPLYDPAGIGSNFDIRLLTIDNIERVEILKGSQSTLYGSDAMAGVINIITKKNTKKGLSSNGMISYGSFQTARANVSLYRHKEKIDYAVNFSMLNTKGINETIDTIQGEHTTDKDGYKQTNAYSSLTYKPNKNILIQPYLRFSTFNQQYDQGAFVDELDLTNTNTNIQSGFKNEFLFGKSRLTFLYNYNNSKREYIDDSVKSMNGYSKYSQGNYNGKEHFADLYFVQPLNDHIKMSAGIDYRRSNTNQSELSIGEDYSSKLGKDSVFQNQTGVYTAIIANTTSGLNAEIGGRWNHHSAYGNNVVYNFNPSFFLDNRYKLFINISSGYKTPSLFQLYSSYGNKNLKPEVSQTNEAGFQVFSKSNKNNIRFTYYERSVQDVIYFFTDPMTYESKYINQDKQKDFGIEIETKLVLDNKSTANFFYSYVDGRVTTLNNGADTSYFNLIRRPKNTLGIHLSRNFTKRLFCNASILSVGKRTDISFDQNFNSIEVVLSKYTVCNFYTEYTFDKSKIKLFADLKNIANAKYTEIYGFNTPGFNMAFGIRYSY